jgi:hypothetical protein
METTETPSFWRKCTTCKKAIAFQQKYWICSVSTCNRQRTGLVFCSVSCFDAHIPVMNHRDAGAFEKKAPTLAEWQKENEPKSPSPTHTAPATSPTSSSRPPSVASAPTTSSLTEQEILVVVSKVKDYIRKTSGMNTSDAVMRRLTTWVTRWCDDAMRMAKQHERQTVMDRDVR